MPIRLRLSIGLLCTGLLLVGCQSSDSDEPDQPPPTDTTNAQHAPQGPSPRSLAAQYLGYAYQGALLRSDHPLNDSLSALAAGTVGGSGLTVIDTFHVDSVRTVDSTEHAVRVRVPHSVRVQSVTWDTSAPRVDQHHTVRIRNGKVLDAPYVAGWPAVRSHLRDVVPERADSLITLIDEKLQRSPAGTGI